jgi:hypothetical protein
VKKVWFENLAEPALKIAENVVIEHNKDNPNSKAIIPAFLTRAALWVSYRSKHWFKTVQQKKMFQTQTSGVEPVCMHRFLPINWCIKPEKD